MEKEGDIVRSFIQLNTDLIPTPAYSFYDIPLKHKSIADSEITRRQCDGADDN
ncbi:hypothetical protein GCM10023155_19600 [Bremerella cremea]